MEQLETALHAVKTLRTTVGQVFETLGNGVRAEHGEDGEQKFLQELQDLLNATNTQLRLVRAFISKRGAFLGFLWSL